MSITTGLNGDASDFINESERDGTPANDAGRVPKLEDDGYLSPAWLDANPVVRVYSSNDTWSKPAGLKYIVVELVGGGGPGGRNGSSAATSVEGGCAGGYSRKKINASALSATEAVTVGAGGVSSASPTQGGTSSFGSHCQATGGTKDTPGVGSGGDINLRGGPGGTGGDSTSKGGEGGDSFFGGGAPRQTGNNNAGNAGQQGGGGGGATSNNSSSTKEGGTGGEGLLVLTEYFI